MLEMVVHGVTLDPVSQMPIVVLKAKDNEEIFLPIWSAMLPSMLLLSLL